MLDHWTWTKRVVRPSPRAIRSATSTSKPRTCDGSAGSASTKGAPPSASPPHRSVACGCCAAPSHAATPSAAVSAGITGFEAPAPPCSNDRVLSTDLASEGRGSSPEYRPEQHAAKLSGLAAPDQGALRQPSSRVGLERR